MNAAEMNKFKFPFFDRPGRHNPGFQRVFFLLFATKIDQRCRDRDELFFSPSEVAKPISLWSIARG